MSACLFAEADAHLEIQFLSILGNRLGICFEKRFEKPFTCPQNWYDCGGSFKKFQAFFARTQNRPFSASYCTLS